jgi:hypothetical protein
MFMPLASGTRLGPYELLAPVGVGGMFPLDPARGEANSLAFVSSGRRAIPVSPSLRRRPRGPDARDVSPDGERFLAIVPEVVADELPLSAVVDWTAELEKR